jgi:hypothetical protein
MDDLDTEDYENCFKNWLGEVTADQEKQRQKDIQLDNQTKLINRISFYVKNDPIFNMNLETFVINYEREIKK